MGVSPFPSPIKLQEQIDELVHLETIAKLDQVKEFIKNEIIRLRGRKAKVESELARQKGLTPSNDLGIILVNNYMWDQTDESIKIYIEIDKKETINELDISLNFTDNNGITCIFGKFRFTIGQLYKPIRKEKCSVKITKSNRLIITLVKVHGEQWASLNQTQSTFKEPSKEDKDLDPSAGLINLMKKMYDEGDDEMKRTIAKSMYESRNKGGQADDMLGGMPNF